MKKYFIFLLTIASLIPFRTKGQGGFTPIEGKVSYITSSHIYVRFGSTEGIAKGDTLYYSDHGKNIPVLVVNQKSSTSCVCGLLGIANLPAGTAVIHMGKFKTADNNKKADDVSLPVPQTVVPSGEADTSNLAKEKNPKGPQARKQLINGRLTFSTNGSINPGDDNNFQRIRTVFSMNVKNIGSSAFSVETYVTYRHRYGVDQVTSGFYNDFKVFGLAANYDNGGRYTFTLGRKINPFMANMGAMDGLQAAVRFGKYQVGAFAGTRPDFNNYSFSAKLPQAGAFVVRTDTLGGMAAQTSLAVAEQMNDFRTDRRFLYFQHNNSLFKNMNLFLSSEVDLFKKVDSIATYRPSLTSIYASLRYRLMKNMSLTASYDNRRNVIYYESYQTFVDQLLAQETRQGFRLQATYSPWKFVSVNASAFLRYQGSNPSPTKNYVLSANLTNLAGRGSYLSLSLNMLESYYFKGTISGIRLSESLLKGKMNLELQYRNVSYTFFANESKLAQNIGGVNLSVNIFKMTTLTCSYEGTFQQSGDWHRYFVTFIQRFKN